MVQLHEKMNFLRQKVLKRAFAKLPNLTDKERRIIDIMTQRLEHKFLRRTNDSYEQCCPERQMKNVTEI